MILLNPGDPQGKSERGRGSLMTELAEQESRPHRRDPIFVSGEKNSSPNALIVAQNFSSRAQMDRSICAEIAKGKKGGKEKWTNDKSFFSLERK